MLTNYLLLIFSLFVMIFGGEILVKSSSRIASSFGLSEFFVGVFIIGFGTSLPELAVSIHATLSGNLEASSGNVIGSNIFNMLGILGVLAMMKPVPRTNNIPSVDLFTFEVSAIILFLFSLNGKVSFIENLVLCILMLVYIATRLSIEKKNSFFSIEAINTKSGSTDLVFQAAPRAPIIWQIILLVIGLTTLIFGAQRFTDSAVNIAKYFGLSDYLIGITILGIGTSLPELVSSVLSARKGNTGLVIGNILGSNIFNIFIVFGASGVLVTSGIPMRNLIVLFDLPLLILISLLFLPWVIYRGLSRTAGSLALVVYVGYLISSSMIKPF